MLHATRSRFCLRACLAGLLTLLPLHAAHASAAYSFQDVGNDGNYLNSTGKAISDNGIVVGDCDNFSSYAGFMWQNKELTDLPYVPGTDAEGTPTLYPQAVNAGGIITGNEASPSDGNFGFVYQNGASSAFTNIQDGIAESVGLGINTAGQIAGEGGSRPIIYQNGQVTILPDIAGFSGGSAYCLNNASPYEAAGDCQESNTFHATLWKNNVAYDLGTLGGPTSYAYGINDSGQVVGTADLNQKDSSGLYIHHAFLWTPTTANGTSGTMKDLGVIDGGPNSQANGINNAGTVVGSAGQFNTGYAFVWTSAGGMKDLDTLVGPISIIGVGTPDSSNFETANAINASGQIAATIDFSPSQYPNDSGYSYHGCVLTPTGGGTTTAALSSLKFSPTSVAAGTNSVGTITLTAAAPTGGALVDLSTDGALPQTFTVPAGDTSAAYYQESGELTAGNHTVAASYAGKTVSATLTVTSNSSLPKPVSISYSPSSFASGATTTGTVTLSAAAPSGGAAVAIIVAGSSNGTLTIASGQTKATFSLTASGAAGTYSSSAVYNGSQATTTFTISGATSVALSSLSLSPASVTGGASSTGTVKLSAATPTGGAVISLKSSSADATLPGSVTVSAGATSATFTVKTTTVSAAATATITAAYNSVSKTATLTINPASSGVSLQSVTLSPTSTVGGSAATTANRAYLTGTATADTTVTLSSSNTAVATVPSSILIKAGSSSHTFTITTSSVKATTTVTITAKSNGVTQTATLTVTPAASGSVAISSLAFSPNSVYGGKTSTGTVTLASGAPSGGEKVSLSSSESVATVPSSVTVAAGATTATFTVGSTPVASSTKATITATAGSSTKTASITVNPPKLSGLALSPSSVTGGSANATGTVTLNDPAPSSGEVVSLTSSNTSALTVPSSVTVASGKTTATFTATSKVVTSAATVTVTATMGSISETATETVNPGSSSTVVPKSIVSNPNPVYSSSESTVTVTLTGAAPSGGVSVSITLNGSAFYTGTVASGQSSLAVGVNWGSVTSATSEKLVATANGTSVSTTVTLEPTSVTLKSFAFSPSTVKGGASSTATATLSAAAPSGGAVVQVTYNGGASYTLTIPAGSTSGSYTQPTTATSSTEAFTYTAAYNGASKSATLTATP